MAEVNIDAFWSDDKKTVCVSADDWEKIILILEKSSNVHQHNKPKSQNGIYSDNPNDDEGDK